MKLATYRDGSRDGQLVVVSKDLCSAHYATAIAGRLQQVLDDWNFLSPQLQDLSHTLNQGKARHTFDFEPARCMAPLPRAFQWIEGSACLAPVQRMYKARGADLPQRAQTNPLMIQGSSDGFLGACENALFADDAAGIDCGAGLAVITADVPRGAPSSEALESIRLLMLVNAWSLRQPVADDTDDEPAADFGVLQGRPATAFSPVAVTPDELGSAWQTGRAHLPLKNSRNGQSAGRCDAGAAMGFHFGQLIAQACKTRRMSAGSIVGSGPVSDSDAACGASCIAEKRAIETIESGVAKTPFMTFGDTIRIEIDGPEGHSVFGAIEQTVVRG